MSHLGEFFHGYLLPRVNSQCSVTVLRCAARPAGAEGYGRSGPWMSAKPPARVSQGRKKGDRVLSLARSRAESVGHGLGASKLPAGGWFV